MKINQTVNRHASVVRAWSGTCRSVGALLVAALAAAAGATDISLTPLATLSNIAAKPNIMFILDSSGSMASPYMPDDAAPTSTESYAFAAHQCNGLAFDPTQSYPPPLNADGTSKANVSFTAAPVDGYNATLADSTTSTTSATIGAGTQTLFLANNMGDLDAGMPVKIRRTSDSTKWMTGIVKYWNSGGTPRRRMVVEVTATLGSGTFSDWTVDLLTTANLTGQYYYNYSGTQTPQGWTYNTSGSLVTTFYNECTSAIGASPGSAKFTKVAVSVALQQAYANWYSYYRTRVLLMRTSVGAAFVGLDTNYRVGFTTIIDTGVTPGAGFLDVADFSASQKSLFISKLYAATPGSTTPLRGALTKTGRYFAKQFTGQTDPMQYSCQRNYAILSTDGYWNNNNESSTYGPLKLDGSTAIGQQDGAEARPMRDGANTVVTSSETYTSTATTIRTTDQLQNRIDTQTTTTTATTPTTWSRTNRSLGSTNPNTSKTNSNVTRTCSGVSPNITCTVTVTTSTTHSLSSPTDTVLVSGVTPSAYNNGGAPVTTTRLSSTKYSYVLTGLTLTPAVPSGGQRGSTVRTSSTYGNCPSGQGLLTSTPQTGSGTDVSTSSAILTTTYSQTLRDLRTTVVATPRTHTVVTTNDVVTSDTDVAGPGAATTTITNATTATLPNTTLGPVASTAASGPVVTQPSTWANSGAAVTSCAGSAPAVTATKTGSGSPSSSIAAAVSTTGTWANSGAAVVTTPTPTTVESARTASTPVTTTSGGASDTLADVAEYYYMTDLRTSALGNCTGAAGVDVCQNILTAGAGSDTANWQHMTTYTIGLGVSGTLTYDPNYLTQSTGSYVNLTQGTANWPNPGDGLEAVNIDDLWHAAVNGRGKYFAAKDATGLSAAITGALTSAGATVGTGSSAAVSTLSLVNGGNNQAYLASYTTLEWTGDLTAHAVNSSTGAVDTSVAIWSARTRLDSMAASSRWIFHRKPGSTVPQTFDYATLSTNGFGGNFTNFCTKSNVPQQCATLTATQKTSAADGTKLVNFLRGDNAYEVATNSTDPFFRTRTHKLGDFVNGSPVYVQKPPFSYADTGYSAYVASKSSRKAMVYAAGNDGMLHAFSAATVDGGTEMWAYVPSMVMSNMYRLADTAYATNHQFYVDGTPVVGDIFDGTDWKTILVGGLNGGGKGYYALDISDPASPKTLWEFSSDANLGLSYGNPIITKRADGTWVVVVTSGYNNTAGDGLGHLYVLNANTGSVLLNLATTAGSSVNPSGLAKINAWVDTTTDNKAMRFYGGDLLGNLWRFDIDNRIAPSGNEATLLANFTVGTTPQPITSIPKTLTVSSGASTYPVVVLGTGQYLGTSDITTTDQQSIYAIKDTLAATGWGNIRAGTSPLVTKTATLGTNTSTVSTNTVDWGTKAGWVLDLPTSRERVSVDMEVQFNTLAAVTAIPGGNICSPSGSSWLYLLNVADGSAAGANPVALGNFLAAGITWVQTSGGDSKLEISGEVVNNKPTVRTAAVGSSAAAAGTVRRSSWREIVD